MKNLRKYLLLGLMLIFANQAWAGKAINFAMNDSKGKTQRLSDYRGKWVLVNFWAPWCPRCWMEFPLLNDMDARKDFVVIGVAMDYGMDEKSVQSYIDRYNLRYPQVMGGNRRDADSPAHQVGPVDFYPTSYLYAPDGELVMFIPGIVSENRVTAFMDDYMRENPTAVAAKPRSRSDSSGAKPAKYKKPAARTSPQKKISSVY